MNLISLKKYRNSCIALVATASVALSQSAFATPLYSQGFEDDIGGWDAFSVSFYPVRVVTGTNGVTSASGNAHAEAGTSATNWGGYNSGTSSFTTSFQSYFTSIDIFLDVDGQWANDTRFDFSSAIGNTTGGFLQDFVFNGGFYSDDTGPGANTNRFIFSASSNAGRANSYPKNPGRDPFSIDASGWYTFTHNFFENAGQLEVELSIADMLGTNLKSWTLGSIASSISEVGGNRYGWFVQNEFSVLAFDNTSLTVTEQVSAPGTLGLLGFSLIGLGWMRRKKA